MAGEKRKRATRLRVTLGHGSAITVPSFALWGFCTLPQPELNRLGPGLAPVCTVRATTVRPRKPFALPERVKGLVFRHATIRLQFGHPAQILKLNARNSGATVDYGQIA